MSKRATDNLEYIHKEKCILDHVVWNSCHWFHLYKVLCFHTFDQVLRDDSTINKIGTEVMDGIGRQAGK